MTKTNLHKQTTDVEKETIKERLKALLGTNRRIYQVITKVSTSGMSRHIANFAVSEGELLRIDWEICKLLKHTRRSEYGVFITGCGMDMGFSIAYSLGEVLFPKGDGKTVTGRNGDTEPETDGGYLIKQIWI